MLVCPANNVEPSATLAADTAAWAAKYDAQGVRIIGEVLGPESAGVTVGDGPEAPTSAIAGFDVLECRDLKHAQRVVEEHPMSRLGSIVVRPFAFQ